MMKKLVIKRIKVDGEYGFDKSFSDGLHILTGSDNSCGKSLFIRLIDFALGDQGTELKELIILKKCTFFYAEIQLVNETFTIRRNINQIDKKIDFFAGKTIDEVLAGTITKYEDTDVDQYQKYLFKSLTGFDYIKTVAPKSGKFTSISFSFFSNLFYLNQGVEAGQIFRYSIMYFPLFLREKIFSLYLNTNKIKKSIPEVEIHNLKEDLKASIEKLNIERQFFSTNVTDNNFYGELEKKERLKKEIDALNYSIKEQDSKIISLEIISKNEQAELSDLNRQLVKLNDEIEHLQFNGKEHAKLINDYREDVAKTEKNITAFNLFKKFELKTCPECGKELVLGKVDKDCPLCKEEFDDKQSDENYVEKNMSYLSYLKDSLNDCLDVFASEKKELDNKIELKKGLTEKILHLERVLRDKIDNLKNPILEEKIKFQSDLATKFQMLIEIDNNLKILEKFRGEDSRLEKLKVRMSDLDKEINKIEQDKEDRDKEKSLMDSFRTNFNSFFNNTNYPYFERGFVDEDFQIQVTTSKDGQKSLDKVSSMSDKIIVRLGLFFSLLKTALGHSEVNHPRLLYLDSPRDQELKWDRFCESLLKFKQLLDEKPQGQVFITVVVDGNNQFAGQYADLTKHAFMNLTNQEGGMLLRKTKNEPEQLEQKP